MPKKINLISMLTRLLLFAKTIVLLIGFCLLLSLIKSSALFDASYSGNTRFSERSLVIPERRGLDRAPELD